MPRPQIAEPHVLSLDKHVVCVLPGNELGLCKQTINSIEHNLAFHVPSSNKDLLVWPYTFHVKTCNSALLDFLVSKRRNLLLRMIKKAHLPLRAADSQEVFYCCDCIWHSLCYLCLTLESV